MDKELSDSDVVTFMSNILKCVVILTVYFSMHGNFKDYLSFRKQELNMKWGGMSGDCKSEK